MPHHIYPPNTTPTEDQITNALKRGFDNYTVVYLCEDHESIEKSMKLIDQLAAKHDKWECEERLRYQPRHGFATHVYTREYEGDTKSVLFRCQTEHPLDIPDYPFEEIKYAHDRSWKKHILPEKFDKKNFTFMDDSDCDDHELGEPLALPSRVFDPESDYSDNFSLLSVESDISYKTAVERLREYADLLNDYRRERVIDRSKRKRKRKCE